MPNPPGLQGSMMKAPYAEVTHMCATTLSAFVVQSVPYSDLGMAVQYRTRADLTCSSFVLARIADKVINSAIYASVFGCVLSPRELL